MIGLAITPYLFRNLTDYKSRPGSPRVFSSTIFIIIVIIIIITASFDEITNIIYPTTSSKHPATMSLVPVPPQPTPLNVSWPLGLSLLSEQGRLKYCQGVLIVSKIHDLARSQGASMDSTRMPRGMWASLLPLWNEGCSSPWERPCKSPDSLRFLYCSTKKRLFNYISWHNSHVEAEQNAWECAGSMVFYED